MSRRYLLTAIEPINCAPAHYCEHQFAVECDAALAWVREHADELAARLVPRYTALNVKEQAT